jgi:hypothetical protein
MIKILGLIIIININKILKYKNTHDMKIWKFISNFTNK